MDAQKFARLDLQSNIPIPENANGTCMQLNADISIAETARAHQIAARVFFPRFSFSIAGKLISRGTLRVFSAFFCIIESNIMRLATEIEFAKGFYLSSACNVSQLQCDYSVQCNVNV